MGGVNMSAVDRMGRPIRRGPESPQWRGGRCTSSAYVTLLVPDHPRAGKQGRVCEHVLVAERALGKYLPSTAEVHHVDENKQNNDPHNLVICQDHAYHGLLHRRMRAFKACGNPNARCCVRCGSYRDQEDIRVSRGGQSYHRSCQAKHERERKAAIRAARRTRGSV